MPIEPKSHHDVFALPADVADFRKRTEREREERAAERQAQIAQQSSPFSSPEERIQRWEKLHGLGLPRSATHKLLRVIADQTDLSMQQVLETQQRRAFAAAAAATP